MEDKQRNLESKPENGLVCVIHVRNPSSKINPFTDRSWKVVCDAADIYGDVLPKAGTFIFLTSSGFACHFKYKICFRNMF